VGAARLGRRRLARARAAAGRRQGHWSDRHPGTPAPRGPGAARPGAARLVDAHSHAFQRAFVGLAERRDGAHDDFWSWRDRMYGVALRITPDALRAVAAQLYAELLQGGYTQVCEFHYLHHDPTAALCRPG
jgi:formimidoylglutamate deiminase